VSGSRPSACSEESSSGGCAREARRPPRSPGALRELNAGVIPIRSDVSVCLDHGAQDVSGRADGIGQCRRSHETRTGSVRVSSSQHMPVPVRRRGPKRASVWHHRSREAPKRAS
jgi:hypothetical protein